MDGESRDNLMKNFIKQFFYLVGGNSKKQLCFLGAIFLISSLMDVLGLGMVGAFLMMILNFQEFLNKLPLTYREFFSHFNQMTLFNLVGIIVVICFLIKAATGIYSQKKIVLFSSQVSTHMRTNLMFLYQFANYTYHIKKNTAYIVNQMSMVNIFTECFLIPSLTLVSNYALLVGIVVALFIVNKIVTVFLIVLFLAIFFVYTKILKKKLHFLGSAVSNSGGEINKSVIQGISGLLEIRILGKESYFLNKLYDSAYTYSKSLSILAVFRQIPRYAIESACAIFMVVLFLVAINIGVNPQAVIPVIGIFAAACLRLLPVTNQILVGVNQIQSANYIVNSFYDEMNNLTLCAERNLLEGNKDRRIEFSKINLDKVSYAYPTSKKKSLFDISLCMKRGESIGIVGPSGAGKSTLVNVILGVLHPSSGLILVDGSPVKNKRAWMNNFAYIPQLIFLLDDTLRRNIALGVNDPDIDEKKLKNALEMAQLLEVVDNLPEGLDTLVGENGVRLSGGQRQRVALARAFYHERDIIVMDEATSALDNETEREVISAIKRLHGLKTMIIIAHRLSTIEHCDRVYRLESGRISASGSLSQVEKCKNNLRSIEN